MKADDGDVTRALTDLARTAPQTVMPAVLAATGLADRFARIIGPTGPLYVAWNDRGISGIAPAADDDEFVAIHADRVGRPVVGPDPLPKRMEQGVHRVLTSGKLGNLPVDLRGATPFQRSVLETITGIPPGEVRSYGWVAKEMGRPGAVRAVGSALNKNPIPVLIPCHRVARSDGAIGQYAFGAQMKRELLAAEGLDPEAAEADAARGVRFVGSNTTYIFCVPTCRNARRITTRHRAEFRSEAVATDSGYRACKVCRPAAA